mgnify:CR=1 FL=1
MTTDRSPSDSSHRGRMVGRRVATLVVAVAVLVSTTGAVGATAGADATADASTTADIGTVPVAQQGNGSGSGGDSLTICDRESSAFVSAFNSGLDSVPGFVKSRLSDSDVHLAIDGDGGGDYTMETDSETQVTDASEGEPSSPSVRVITDCETFRNITDASDPGSRFQTAYDNDRIRFVGVGAVDWLFFAGIETATDPLSLAVVLFLFLILLVVAYLVVRRVTSYYREEEAT